MVWSPLPEDARGRRGSGLSGRWDEGTTAKLQG